MIKTEILLHWGAVAFYIVSAVLFIYSFAFRKTEYMRWGTRAALAGLLPHTAALGLRWAEAGHGPYLRIYEVYSSDVWIIVVMFLLVQKWLPATRPAGTVVMPVSFLMIGMAVMSSPEIRPLPSTFRTFWLLVHIFFAKVAFGSLLLATGLAALYLVKERTTLPVSGGVSGEFRESGFFDEASYNLTGFGFLMLGIMIVSGAIWADNAWGAYWTWDPVETWSLISWLVYGIYLHLRRTYGWRGVRSAWFLVFALVILVFALFGMGYFYPSQHSPYISG